MARIADVMLNRFQPAPGASRNVAAGSGSQVGCVFHDVRSGQFSRSPKASIGPAGSRDVVLREYFRLSSPRPISHVVAAT